MIKRITQITCDNCNNTISFENLPYHVSEHYSKNKGWIVEGKKGSRTHFCSLECIENYKPEK